jgi:hypothetical protein
MLSSQLKEKQTSIKHKSLQIATHTAIKATLVAFAGTTTDAVVSF